MRKGWSWLYATSIKVVAVQGRMEEKEKGRVFSLYSDMKPVIR